jgi:hypothetical protein
MEPLGFVAFIGPAMGDLSDCMPYRRAAAPRLDLRSRT